MCDLHQSSVGRFLLHMGIGFREGNCDRMRQQLVCANCRIVIHWQPTMESVTAAPDAPKGGRANAIMITCLNLRIPTRSCSKLTARILDTAMPDSDCQGVVRCDACRRMSSVL